MFTHLARLDTHPSSPPSPPRICNKVTTVCACKWMDGCFAVCVCVRARAYVLQTKTHLINKVWLSESQGNSQTADGTEEEA